MSELTPITRVESYLDAIVNNGIPPTEDITRIETFLQAIYDNQVCQLTPITRIEMFLGKISGQDIELPQPITRAELYLAAIAGEDVELPENPITRLEMYLAEWADSGDWTTISGSIVEFITQRAHKLKSCVVNLSPKQDLHGYDSPWPDGGGKNKVQVTASSATVNGITFTVNSDGTVTANGTATAEAVLILNNTTMNTGAGTFTGSGATGGSGSTYYLQFRVDGLWKNCYASITFENTETGVTGVLIDIKSGITMNNYVFKPQLEAGSTATAYAPYSNICPISGWTGVSVWDTGHNVWDEEWEIGYINSTTGQDEINTSYFRPKNYIPIKPNTQYYFKCPNTYSDYARFYYYDRNKAFISYIGTLSYMNNAFTTPDNAYYMRFVTGEKIGVGVTYNHDISINYPSNDTEYHAYNGNSYSVTWEDEVFGAEPDLISGEMPVTKNLITIGPLSWDYYNGVFYANVVGKANNNASTNVICSVYAQGSRNATGAGDAASILQDKQITGFYDPNSANSWVYVKDSSYATALAFKTAMGEQTICYELATPIQATITPTPITAIKGYNAMWSDGDSIKVTVHGTPVEVSTQQALNMLLGGAYRNDQTADDVSDDEALDIILGGEQR